MPKPDNLIKGSWKNVYEWFEGSSEEAKEYGSNFYYNAHNIATEVGYQLGLTGYEATTVGSAIIAVFSPRTDWDKNVEYAFEYVNTGWVQNQTQINNAKASLLVAGHDPMTVMGRTSYKVKPFFKAILSPDEDNEVTDLMGFRKPVKLAVVDRHVGGVYYGKPLKEFQRHYLGYWRVTRRISNANFKVAREFNLPVNVIQAVTWAEFRNQYKYAKST